MGGVRNDPMPVSFEQIDIARWPSHDCRPMAVLRLEPADLCRTLGIAFRDDRDDLDELMYAGLRLPQGDQILLLRHAHAPRPGTEVHGDANADSDLLLQKFLSATGLGVDQVGWRAPGPRKLSASARS